MISYSKKVIIVLFAKIARMRVAGCWKMTWNTHLFMIKISIKWQKIY